jgi:hypothetical protein
LDTVPTAGAADAGLFVTDEQIRSTTKHDRDGRVDIAVSFGKGINMLYAVFRLQAQKQGERSRMRSNLSTALPRWPQAPQGWLLFTNLRRSLKGFPETPAYAAVELE